MYRHGSLLVEWMQLEKRNYYRIVFPDANQSTRLIFYDVDQLTGTYNRKDSNESPIDFGMVQPIQDKWDTELNRLRAMAIELDAKFVVTNVVCDLFFMTFTT